MDHEAPQGNDEREEEEFLWESEARSVIRSMLSDAELDDETGTATLSGGREFDNLEDLRDALIEIGDAEMINHVPWEGGPVFETDSDDIVDAELDRAGVYDFFRRLDTCGRHRPAHHG